MRIAVTAVMASAAVWGASTARAADVELRCSGRATYLSNATPQSASDLTDLVISLFYGDQRGMLVSKQFPMFALGFPVDLKGMSATSINFYSREYQTKNPRLRFLGATLSRTDGSVTISISDGSAESVVIIATCTPAKTLF